MLNPFSGGGTYISLACEGATLQRLKATLAAYEDIRSEQPESTPSES